MEKRARFIYNPSSGKEKIKAQVAYILDRLEKMGYETSAFATTGENDAKNEAARCAENGFELLVVAGGDGTVYEVINGISGLAKRPKLAIIPAGTSNDFARAIGVSKKVKAALDVIEIGVTSFVDVGKMNDKYFINIAAGGSLTEITYEVPSRAKTLLGKFAYHLKGIEKLPEFKPFEVEITMGNVVIKEEAMLFLVANSNVVGGFNKMAPDASLNDGLLDVFVVKKSGITKLIQLMAKLTRGEHTTDNSVLFFKASQFEIVTGRELKMNVDGEYGGVSPASFHVLPNHLEVFVGA